MTVPDITLFTILMEFMTRQGISVMDTAWVNDYTLIFLN